MPASLKETSILVLGGSPGVRLAAAKARQYIKTFIAKMNEASNAAELQAEMNRIYPDVSIQFCLEYGSKILKDGWIWEGQWPESLRNMTAR